MKLANFLFGRSSKASDRNTHVAPASSSAESLMIALKCVAVMQGITLSEEQLSGIRNILCATEESRACTYNNTSNDTCTDNPSKKPEPKSSKSKQENRYKQMIQKLEAFVRTRYAFRFNEITGYTEVAELDEASESHTYHVVSQRDLNSISNDAQCAGVECWDRDVIRFVNSNKAKGYHPFLSYFEALPEWDGIDRVTPLAQRVADSSLWINGFHRWMLGMTAQWMGRARKQSGCTARANSVAPILISEEQGWGKSTFCRMLVPEELQHYYTDSFDVAQPAASECKLTEYGLINLDEFDKIPASKNAQLKTLMQMTALSVRKAFQKTANNKFRIASFIGTSNSRDLLSDKTGSRRFLCVELEHPIDCDTPIEYTQLYAQLKAEIEAGERHWFNAEEEREMQQNNAQYYQSFPEEELFRQVYKEVERDEEGAMFLPAATIFGAMKREFPREMAGMTIHKFNRLLPLFAHKTRTRNGNGYYVVKVQGVEAGKSGVED